MTVALPVASALGFEGLASHAEVISERGRRNAGRLSLDGPFGEKGEEEEEKIEEGEGEGEIEQRRSDKMASSAKMEVGGGMGRAGGSGFDASMERPS